MIKKNKHFLRAQLLLLFLWMLTNSLSAQKLKTYNLDISNASSTIYPEKKYDLTILLPVSNRQNLMFGYSPFDKLNIYTSFQNQSDKGNTSLSTGGARLEGDYKLSSQSYNLSVGWNLFSRKQTKEMSTEDSRPEKKKSGVLIEGRLGLAEHRISGDYIFEGIADPKSKLFYSSIEAGLHLVVINKTGHLKISNKYVRTNYSKISLEGPTFSTTSTLKVIDELRNDNIIHFYILEISGQFNIKRFGILAGVVASPVNTSNAIRYIRFQGSGFIGLNFKFNSFKKRK